MTNSEQGSSNPRRPHASAQTQEDQEYLNTRNANVSNFVSVQLSGEENYHLWETQMLCLLESYSIRSIVDDVFNHPRKKQYDSLVKGWIFGSISEGVLRTVFDLDLAKDVWYILKFYYSEQETDTEDDDVVAPKARTKDRDVASTEIEDEEAVQTEINARGQDRISIEGRYKLWKAIREGKWSDIKSTLKNHEAPITAAIDSDGNTLLHIAVGIGLNHFVRGILSYILNGELPEMKNSYGSTPLHVAAMFGNIEATNLLIKKNRGLLEIKDINGNTPLDNAYEYMHIDTIVKLIKAEKSSSPPPYCYDVHTLINAISLKKYDLAIYLLKYSPESAVGDKQVLMAIAKNFPSGLDYDESLIYPIMDYIPRIIVNKAKEPFSLLVDFYISIKDSWDPYETMSWKIAHLVVMILFQIPLLTLLWIFVLIRLLIWMVYFPFFIFYWLLWDVAARLGIPPFKHIEEKKREWEKAKEVLYLVCDKIDKQKRTHYYKEPILEAARQNACEVVDEILMRSPEAIRYKDKSGYDIIQLAVIYRSEKIYNLISVIGNRKKIYRTIRDSSGNNMLHLAGKLAPTHALKRSRGAAFQLQRELQWREEVKKIMHPNLITSENIFRETPDMVFTREHENLMKEGEKWLKGVAESCSITASLIITIVFAAAITVPGGSNQETGIPLFTEDIAFTIFAISNAISLFASSTALLMFLSILTGCFAEQDFLVRLPRRMNIGLCTLMISTTAMMVAFGATMFIVFCGRKPWMLAPICVSAFLPIASLATLQFPLIVDLFRSRYVPIFGNKVRTTRYKFNNNRIPMLFGK
ncbi:hypothetical protein L1887_38467 [Cichorium endivia]|nr:hypothetical protein L1887_38467 [Cichorium endivia]